MGLLKNYELAGVAVAVRVGVGVGCGVGVNVGCGVGRGVIRRMAGVGVGRLGSGVTVRTKPKAMLKTTTKLSIPKRIRCLLLCERLTLPSDKR